MSASTSEALFGEAPQEVLRRLLSEDQEVSQQLTSFLQARESLIRMLAEKSGGDLALQEHGSGNALTSEVISRAASLGATVEPSHLADFVETGGHGLSTLGTNA